MNSGDDIKAFIHNSNLIEGIDDMKADADSAQCWFWITTLDKLSHVDVCKAQKMITKHQTELKPEWRGYYRLNAKQNVQVGGRICPDYTLVGDLMEDWLQSYGDWSKPYSALDAHVEFELIHPFVDGNGRTGRMLVNWAMYRRKNPIVPFRIENREEYYEMFRNAQ